jgi:hypothetical protein
MDRYSVVEYTKKGEFVATISGMGRNAGTWDSSHSRRTAQKYAAQLRRENKDRVYKVEETV